MQHSWLYGRKITIAFGLWPTSKKILFCLDQEGFKVCGNSYILHGCFMSKPDSIWDSDMVNPLSSLNTCMAFLTTLLFYSSKSSLSLGESDMYNFAFCNWAYTMMGPILAYGPITTGLSCLIIPAFSLAINYRVFPSIFSWSIPIEVMIDNYGVITLVVSYLPPRPT